jgi:hypothetical protein
VLDTHRLLEPEPQRGAITLNGKTCVIKSHFPRGGLRRPHPQRREACRSAGAGPDQVRNGAQSQDRKGARPRYSRDRARPRRRPRNLSINAKLSAISDEMRAVVESEWPEGVSQAATEEAASLAIIDIPPQSLDTISSQSLHMRGVLGGCDAVLSLPS